MQLLFQTLCFLFYGFTFAIIATSLMKIKPNTMTRTIYLFLSLLITALTVNAQKGINFHSNYAAGGKMLMNIDSSAKNVFYSLGFPNQPFTAFNFLPEVYNVSVTPPKNRTVKKTKIRNFKQEDEKVKNQRSADHCCA